MFEMRLILTHLAINPLIENPEPSARKWVLTSSLHD